jgi:hypothetical protein
MIENNYYELKQRLIRQAKQENIEMSEQEAKLFAMKIICHNYARIRRHINIQKIVHFILLPLICAAIVINNLLILRIYFIITLVWNYVCIRDLFSKEQRNEQWFDSYIAQFEEDQFETEVINNESCNV